MTAQRVQRSIDVVVLLAWVLPTTACVLGIAMLLLTGNKAGGHDIVSYWAAAKQLHQGANPYDHAGVLALQRANGLPSGNDALMVRNPPPMLPIIAPLGYLSLRSASLFWSSMLLGAWVISCWLLCKRRNRTLLLLLFAPALLCIMAGQSAIFCLLGVVLFQRFLKSLPFVAGACLFLCALKPHLFVPAAGVFLAYCVFERHWRVLAGFVTALVGAAGIAFALDRQGWGQYQAMMAAEPLQREFIPCLGVALRTVLNAKPWLQYVPCLIALALSLAFYARHRTRWNWFAFGPLLVAVSVVFAPYAWITDQVLLLPAVWQLLDERFSFAHVFALISAVMAIQFLASVSLHSPWFLWSAPAWLAVCAYGVRKGTLRQEVPSIQKSEEETVLA